MVTIKEYPVDQILDIVASGIPSYVFHVDGTDFKVKMTSERYKLFCNETKCVACGLQGTVMRLETHLNADVANHNPPHFNLYGVEAGEYILMTKDHKIPRSKGGKDRQDNYQVMCTVCNTLKGNHNYSMETIRKLRSVLPSGNLTKARLGSSIRGIEKQLHLISTRKGRMQMKNLPDAVDKSFEPFLIAKTNLCVYYHQNGELITKAEQNPNKPKDILQVLPSGSQLTPLGCIGTNIIIKLEGSRYCLVSNNMLAYPPESIAA